MKTRQISNLKKSILPILHHLIIVAFLLVLSQCSAITPGLFPNVWRVNMVEHRKNNNVVIFIFVTTLHYFNEFVQAPCWKRIVLREHDKKQSGLFDCFHEFWPNIISFFDLVVYVGMDIGSTQSSVKMACESRASVVASKADENIIFFHRYSSSMRGRGRRRSHRYVCVIVLRMWEHPYT